MKGKLTIDKPHKICDICSNPAIYNVKRIMSYEDCGRKAEEITVLNKTQLNYFMEKTASLRSLPRKERGRINISLIHKLVWTYGNNEDERRIVGSISNMYENILIFADMLRSLKTVDEAAYYRRVKIRNKLIAARHKKPRVYPTCYYVCSETCLNMLILQRT